jgi:hypothetical protein
MTEWKLSINIVITKYIYSLLHVTLLLKSHVSITSSISLVHSVWYNKKQYSTVRCNAMQCNTLQYNTIQIVLYVYHLLCWA